MDFNRAFEEQHHIRHSLAIMRDVPALATTKITGRLILNRLALQLMGLKHGDRVHFIDLGAEANVDEDRFFITRGFELDGAWIGCFLQKEGTWYHSVAYNTLLTHGEFVFYDNLKMISDGYFKRHGTEKFHALKKVSMNLERYIEKSDDGATIELFSPAQGVAPQPFFKLTNWQLVTIG
jgi:hypothetical protein